MKQYLDIITLNKNQRGCYILDTVKGCSCMAFKKNGCYENCYANNIANRYNYDFSKPILRMFNNTDYGQLYFSGFKNMKHENSIINAVKNKDVEFIRIGEMGDPSENWEHTINICETISLAKKPIVIITKHWKTIPYLLLNKLKKMNIYINTSISALDNDTEIKHRLTQYESLKNYCSSILRIVSCDFNKDNKEGCKKHIIQEKLFDNDKIIDTIFRPHKENKLIKDNIINVSKVKFLRSEVLASVYNKNTFFGYCNTCPEKCGINL